MKALKALRVFVAWLAWTSFVVLTLDFAYGWSGVEWWRALIGMFIILNIAIYTTGDSWKSRASVARDDEADQDPPA